MNVSRDRAEVFKGHDGQWYYNIRAGNGEKIADSEGHKNKRDVVALVAQHFPGAALAVLEEDDGA